MKENKNVHIKVRITPTDKEKIQEYCASCEITVSEFIRNAISAYLGGKQNDK